MQLSLAAKGLILVSLPLCFELGIVAVLINLQQQAEIEAALSMRSRKVASSISHLSSEFLDLGQNTLPEIRKQLAVKGKFDKTYKGTIEKLHADYAELEKLSRDKPEFHTQVEQAQTMLMQVESTLDRVFACVDKGKAAATDDELAVLIKLPVLVRDLSKRTQQLESIYRRDWADNNSGKQIELREETLRIAAIAAAINVILSSALAVFLVKDVTGRLRTLSDNAFRLAAGMPLRAPLQGKDEIYQADRIFRQMARVLTELSQKERAVVDNALDTICSIDDDGHFSTANPASFKLFGLEPDELVGSRLVDVIAENDKEELLSWTTGLRNGSGDSEREFMVRRRDHQLRVKDLVPTLWSGHWSDSERSLFFVVHDMTDRKELERAKQELVAMLTHDLRSPLGTILAVLEMADVGMFGPLNERGVRLMKSAERSGTRMASLINDLLDIEKIKSGTMILDKEKLPLQEVFDNVSLNVVDWAAESHVHVECQPTNLLVMADREKFSRVIFNLISNAIKFSPAGGRIVVSASSQLDQSSKSNTDASVVEISITDQGPGIPADMLVTIFERFQQVSDSAHQNKGGSGLGLTICKEIINLHGGKIWATSEPGNGSVFHFTIEQFSPGTVK
ncbi:PAS domain S-box protein [bacterium]|jgi:PAS domain S-box-containing protein|nr:PAS domain S-box protein [bacterium]